jgi:hypothetical protein
VRARHDNEQRRAAVELVNAERTGTRNEKTADALPVCRAFIIYDNCSGQRTAGAVRFCTRGLYLTSLSLSFLRLLLLSLSVSSVTSLPVRVVILARRVFSDERCAQPLVTRHELSQLFHIKMNCL